MLIAAITITESCFNVAGGSGNSDGSPGVVTMVGIITRLAAAGLAFEQQPTGTTPGATISPAVLVRILDRCGNPIVSSTATVTLALGNNPGGATLGGTLSRSAIAGVATFSELSLNKPGTGYTLTASSSGLTETTSSAFNISCQAITVNPSTTTIASRTVGTSFSQSFTQTGGAGTITWSMSPSIPGLSLDATGRLSGTPTAANTFNFTVTATDGNGCPGSRAYSLTINCPTIDLTLTTLAAGTVGAAYPSTTLLPNGGTAPYNFTVSGLPVGLTAATSSTNVVISGTPRLAGSYTVRVDVRDAYDCTNGTSGRSYVLSIAKGTPLITWNNPADITYGTALSNTQLNATADVAGAFTYNPASGTVLNVGTAQSLSVNFTPGDTANYNTASKSVSLNVVKATPVITWNNPANIVYGTALSSTQLNASATVAGSFNYTPATGTVLNVGNGQSLSVTFTPTNTANYNSASKSVAINVLQATLTVSLNNVSRNVGEANPPLTGTVTGLRNGDVITATYSTTATISSPPGAYPITATLNDPGNRRGNYSVTITNGILTILNNCAIALNPATLAQPKIGLPYAQILSASPSGSYTFSLFAGVLPPGVQLVNVLGIYALAGLPTTPGTYNFTLKAKKNNSTCEGFRSYTVTIAPTVAPLLNCVMKNANGTYTAKFGYDNTTGAAVTIPVGANNYFTPGNQNRGQVTTFQPGRVNNAFSVTFNANGSNLSIWFLKGPDGVTRPVNITTATLGCP